MLIAPSDLQARLHDPRWVVFDCRHDLADPAKGERVYREGHVPGAHLARVDLDLSGAKDGRTGRHPLPEPAAFAEFLARHGVTAESCVVAYDDVGGQYAARLWWLARWIGHEAVVLLDGGFPRWQREERAVETSVPSARSGRVVPRPAEGGVWQAAQVEANLVSREAVILDARAPERYRGETEPIDRVAGHIPGALNRFYKENLNPDLTFRPAADLRREFAALLAAAGNRPVVHQCGSGITACANLFAMEYAGLGGSRLYAGSWSEWIADPRRPIAVGAGP